MIKKLTRNVLSTILTVLLAVGVFGIAAPKEVHAASAYTYSLLLTCKDGGANFKGIKIGSTFHNANQGGVNVSLQVDAMPSTFVITVNKKDCTMDSSDMNTNGVKKNITACKVPFEVTGSLTPNHTHTWNNNSYFASGNKITATCQGSGTCDLTKPTLTLTASGKTYDGNVVTATLTKSNTWSSQGLPTPTITYSPANSKNVGTYTASAKVGNATAQQQFTISPKQVTLNWGSDTFTYDGQSHAPTATATGLVGTDTCTVTVGGAQTSAGNHTATATSLSNSNYKLPASNTKQFTINPKELTLSGVTAEENRRYNGTNIANLNTDSKDLEGVVEGDDVSIDTIKGLFEDKNVGNGKQITVNATLKGAAKDNYTIKPVTGLTGNIHHLPTTVSGITANNKTYDGTTEVTVDTSKATFEPMAEGDKLSISATGEFIDASVGEGKTVNLTLGDLAGEDANNYLLNKDDSLKIAFANITAKSMTVSAEGHNGEYDETAHSITVTVSDPTEGYTITYKGPKDTDYSGNNPEFTDPGTYEVTYKVTAPNYEETTGTATVKIIGKDFEGIESSKYEDEYDGNYHGITVTVPDTYKPYTITYSESEDGDYTTAPITYKDFTNGEQTVYYKVSKTGYNDFKGSNTVNITQKEISLQWGETTFEYDGQPHIPTATATKLVSGDSCTVTVDGAQTDSNAKTETENYTATATELSNNNYKLPASVTQTFTINQKEVTLDWGETAFTYTGEAQKPTATATNLVVGDECKVTVKGEQKDSNAKSGTEKYTAEVTGLSDANYKLSQTAETTKDFTIAQAEIKVAGIESFNKVYDGTTDAPAETLNFDVAKLEGKITGDDLGITATGTFDGPNVGDHTITLKDHTLTGESAGNYKFAEDGKQPSCTGKITQYKVKVYAENKTKVFGASDPELTYITDPEKLIGEDVLEGELSRKPGEDVGEYTIFDNTLHDHEGNYAIEYTPGTFTITKAMTNEVTASIEGWTYGNAPKNPSAEATHGENTATFSYSKTADGEYSSTVPTNAGTYYVKATIAETDNYVGAVSDPVKFEIAPKEITIDWTNLEFTYDKQPHIPTATANGLEDGDKCKINLEGEKTNAGSYTANVTGIDNDNYKLAETAETSKDFTIAKAKIVVSGITAEDKTYDGSAEATLVYDDVVLQGNLDGKELSITATGTFEDKNVKGEEEKKIVKIENLKLSGDAKDNYVLASEGQQISTEATIHRMSITVEAEEKTKYYGNADPELTYTVEPKLIEGDSFEGSLTRDPGEDVDDYLIHQGTLSAGNNYKITYNSSELEILQAIITITAENKTSAYGDNLQKLTYSVDVSEGRIPESDELKIKCDTEASNTAVVGEYDITPSWEEENTNYNVKFVKGTYTITQRVVELEWSDTELTYNGKAQKPSATVTNLVDKDECEVTVEDPQTDSNIKTGTDSYTAKATKLSNDNYKLPEEDEKKTTEFTIAPKQLSEDMLSVDPETIKNDGTKKGPNITLNDEEVGDLTDDDYELSGETESNKSGTHFFEVEGKGNYTGTLSSSWVMYENRQNHDKQKGTDGKGDIEIFVDVIGNTENITVDNFTIDFAKKLLSEEDLERYNNGENVLIYVELEEESKDDVTTKDKELILYEFNKVAAKDIRWFDITVWKRIGNDKATQIHDTVDNLEMTISVPDEYKNAPADNTRTFYLARSHDGEADILTKTNEKKVGLASNKFSIYALAYKDTYHGSKYIVPKTGD